MNKCITIVGIGMGDKGSLTVAALDTIRTADVIIGGSRILEAVSSMDGLCDGKRLISVWRPKEICEEIEKCDEASEIAVLMSGDSGFNSGTLHLIKEMKSRGMTYDTMVLPGVGAISSLAARAKVGWEEAGLISLHGKRQNLYQALAAYDKVFILSGTKTDSLMRRLSESVFKESEVYIGEKMGAEDEKIIHLRSALEYKSREFDPMTTTLIFPKSDKRIRLIGMDDDEFIRADVPMTASEVRAVSISRMAIRKTDVVYDIGCGTGSVSVEAAFMASYGQVYSIDKNEAAIELTKKNADRFFCYNITTVHTKAPRGLDDLPAPDVVFIGGSSGEMDTIITAVLKRNPKVRIVINAIMLETLNEAISSLKKNGIEDMEISQVMTAKGHNVNGRHMMCARNPIYIISAGGEG